MKSGLEVCDECVRVGGADVFGLERRSITVHLLISF